MPFKAGHLCEARRRLYALRTLREASPSRCIRQVSSHRRLHSQWVVRASEYCQQGHWLDGKL